MLKRIRWRCSTCPCQVTLTKDSTDPDALWQASPHAVVDQGGTRHEPIVACEAHASLSAGALVGALLGDRPGSEQHRYNMLHAELLDEDYGLSWYGDAETVEDPHPVLGKVPRLDADGRPVMKPGRKRLSPRVRLHVEWDGPPASRAMHVVVVGALLDQFKRDRIDQFINTMWGPGRVTVRDQSDV